MNECSELLADIESLRDECATAARDLMPVADPDGNARDAFKTIERRLTELLERYRP